MWYDREVNIGRSLRSGGWLVFYKGKLMKEKQKDIGGLWSYTSKAGEDYMSGSIEIEGKKHKFVVFKNKYKQQDNHPDYKIFPERDKGISAKHADIPEDRIPY